MNAPREEGKVKRKLKSGQWLQRGNVPCTVCKEQHVEVITGVFPLQTSWASEGGKGHPYMRMAEKDFIEEQRQFINQCLKTIRRLKSQLRSAPPPKEEERT